jgi:hypothetical protein
MLAANWNVETACTNAGRLKDVEQPPIWADRDAIAAKLARGGPPLQRDRAAAGTPVPARHSPKRPFIFDTRVRSCLSLRRQPCATG